MWVQRRMFDHIIDAIGVCGTFPNIYDCFLAKIVNG